MVQLLSKPLPNFFLGSLCGAALTFGLMQSSTHDGANNENVRSADNANSEERAVSIHHSNNSADLKATNADASSSKKLSLAAADNEQSGPEKTNENGLSSIEQAKEALAQGRIDEAQVSLNQIIFSSDDAEEVAQAKAALAQLQLQKAEALAHIPGMMNAKLWTLFEAHKLTPTDVIRQTIIHDSSQSYEDALAFEQADDTLSAADHIAGLMHLSKALGFEVLDGQGNVLSSDDLAAQLKALQNEPDYLPNLAERAEHNLYQGSDIEQSLAFWDYVNVTTLEPSRLDEPQFKESFIRAALNNLAHHKRLKEFGEISARMAHIRWAYPELVQDSRFQAYN